MRHLSIKNLKQHQHYKNRRPPWIKLHAALFDDYAFQCLQDASKAHLMLLWLLASQMDNKIPYDLPFISRKLGVTSIVDVEELVLQGFLEVSQDDGKPLAARKQMTIVETETEAEAERETETTSSSPAAPKPKKRSSDPKYPQYHTEVCQALHAAHLKFRGPINYAVFRRATAKLFPTDYTTEQLVAAVQVWGEWVEVLSPKEAKFQNATAWVEDIHRWVRLGAIPCVDLNGVTERGYLVSGAAR